MAMSHSNACAVAVPSKTVLLKRVLARSATIASNVWSTLLWYSCHPLSAVIGHPLGGFSTCSRSLTTLIIVPATGMSILALSPNRVIRAVQMESLIIPCAAKCSMGSQSCQWKGSMLLSVTIRRIQPKAKASSSCLPLPSPHASLLYTECTLALWVWGRPYSYVWSCGQRTVPSRWAKKCKLQILILIGLVLPVCSVSSLHTQRTRPRTGRV